MKKTHGLVPLFHLMAFALFVHHALGATPQVVINEFIYETAPFPSCHASTLVSHQGQIVAAWFGGLEESDPSVGIWLARREDGKWTEPVEIANGNQASGDVSRYPCWNPVLHSIGNRLVCFYKVGPNPRQWWGMWMESTDGGLTWSEGKRLPENILGPIKNKAIDLEGGRIVSGSSTEDQGWRLHFEWSDDAGNSWKRTEPIPSKAGFGLIQPTILKLHNGDLVALCRSRQQSIVMTRSTDRGQSWSEPEATALPNNNSGIDAVSLKDGGHVLIYNHTTKGRTPLNLAMAANDDLQWQPLLTLETEPGEYSYPAIIQTDDGDLHMTYTWKREKVKYVVVKWAP